MVWPSPRPRDISVADSGHSQIQIFNSQGNFLFKFGQGQLDYRLVWP
jgi:hypothetical protein